MLNARAQIKFKVIICSKHIMTDHPLFTLAFNWETVEADARAPLKDFITKLVGYECQLACKENNGSVDIYVHNIKKKKVTDWIEIQPDGALGVIFDAYKSKEPIALSDRCEDYNDSINVEYESGSESEDQSEDETEEESDN